MRIASWVFVMCTALGAVGAFLPSVELELDGKQVSKRTQVSLYAASANRELVRRLIAAYQHSSQREIGGEVLRTVSPRVGGRLRNAIDHARDAMATLDDVRDDDVRTAGTVLTIALWTLLGLDAAMALLVFTQLMRDSYRRSRLVLALIASVVVTAIALALHAACRVAVAEANEEIGHSTLGLAAGAYVIPIAAIAGMVTAIVLVARSRRAATHAIA